MSGSSPHTRGAPQARLRRRLRERIIPAYAGSTGSKPTRPHRMRDHPRIRGEHGVSRVSAHSRQGSSPHTRGARRRRHGQAQAIRIIPAYAGSTSARMEESACSMDHPRIRGEHLPAQQTGRVGLGSSPHTRGARPCGRAAREAGRIIPAYAGSTRRASRRSRPRPDHPRIRGEHHVFWLWRNSNVGSSPHTRGAHVGDATPFGSHGIIPAYAGSTPDSWIVHAEHWDHPRIRGEHLRPSPDAREAAGSSPHTRGAHPVGLVRGRGLGIIPAYAGSTSPTASAADWAYGSSPHTRGARRRRRGRSAATRIIPAYAGSTLRADRFCACRRDHPRIRGEHGDAFMLTVGGWGSSPHTRGAQSAPGHRQGIRRIIPAYAGSTRAYCQELPKSGDHPRIRGEHSTVPIALIATAGSSPHTRGALAGFDADRRAQRIIPAYAGSTLKVE